MVPAGLDAVLEHVTVPFGIREAEAVERRVQKRVRAVAPLQLENFVHEREPGQEVCHLPAVLVRGLCYRARLKRSLPRAGVEPAEGHRCLVTFLPAIYTVVIAPPPCPVSCETLSEAAVISRLLMAIGD
jgi:hypothetical protein